MAERDAARELHMVGWVSSPTRVDADAVRLLRNVVYELGDADAVTTQWEVDSVLLDCANTNYHNWSGLIIEPILKSWAC